MGSVVSFGGVEHPRKPKASFKKRPAVEPVKVDRRAFDMVVDFQSVGLVGGAFELFGNFNHPLVHGEFSPLLMHGFLSDPLKFCLTDECFTQWQILASLKDGRKEEKKKNLDTKLWEHSRQVPLYSGVRK